MVGLTEEEFNKIYPKELNRKQHQVLDGILAGKSEEEIAKVINVNNTSSVRYHISKIYEIFGLKNESGEHWRLRPDLIRLFIAFEGELVNTKLIDELNYTPEPLLEFPEGSVPLNSNFYVERNRIESDCYQQILQNGALIRIKGAKKTGKTSLVNRIVAEAENKGYKIVRLNFMDAENELFSKPASFFSWFCQSITSQLKLEAQLPDNRELRQQALTTCKSFFQLEILDKINQPVVLVLEEIDRVFPYEKVAKSFLAMMRSLYEEAKKVEIWYNLRIILLHSTEVYVPMNVNQSPFNVGLPIELSEFTPQALQDLARRHQLQWNADKITELMAMVGGHPYLLRLAFYRLARKEITLETLLQTAASDVGIYREHLKSQWATLQNYPNLKQALQQVVNANSPVKLEQLLEFQLLSMALAKQEAHGVIPSCKLYRDYFIEKLRD